MHPATTSVLPTASNTQVRISVTSSSATAAYEYRIRVLRVVAGERSIVHGAHALALRGSLSVLDTDPPLGEPFFYEIVALTNGETLSTDLVSTASVTLSYPPALTANCYPVVVSAPQDADAYLWCTLMKVDAWQYSSQRERRAVLGSPAPTIPFVHPATPGTNLTLHTRTLDERDIMLRIFAQGAPVLIRCPAPIPEHYVYTTVSTLSEARPVPDHRDPRRTWTFPVLPVLRPQTMIREPWERTWRDVYNTFPTWAALRDSRTTHGPMRLGDMRDASIPFTPPAYMRP
jgi:hypothetical protein